MMREDDTLYIIDLSTLLEVAPCEKAATKLVDTIMSEGHGAFFGHIGDPSAEVARIVDIASGNLENHIEPEVEAFAKAVSYCTQQVWGTWDHGAWQGESLDADPQWPLRTWLQTLCPDTIEAIVTVVDTVG